MLETKHLTKKFLNTTALDDVSFTIAPGKIYALLGPNGSGKTTWMKIAAGLSKPTSGEVLYEGEPVGVSSRKDIAYMSTESFFYDWMNVQDIRSWFADFFDDFDAARFDELLQKMELPADKKLKNLSSGMLAKLKTAGVLSRHAKVYLLDEPLNGIDLLSRDAIMDTIISASAPDTAIVISSHLVEELEQYVTDAVFIHNGHLIKTVDTEDVRSEAHDSLADLYREIMK
ncbi:MAG: ABC transporter ATP-binding protein [Lactimicrobium sp.]|jgi:ABC-2 type transport system ATP-binding protein|uniref:ABC transporter ATP-binding protein n=1 Tax=Lactimicrobium sp. TaxID=2563780 RepID=UPI002F35D7D5